MRCPTLRLIGALVILGATPVSSDAQTAAAAESACRPADSTSTRMVAWVTNIVSGTDSASIRQRTQMLLPQVPTGQITYVTDKNVCRKVLSAYNENSTIQEGGTPVSPSGKIYVVKVGTVYVAKDPVKTWGEFVLYVILDAKFRFLASSLG